VSLVNLAMALGIAVEFTAHVLHAYMVAQPPQPPPQPPAGSAASGLDRASGPFAAPSLDVWRGAESPQAGRRGAAGGGSAGTPPPAPPSMRLLRAQAALVSVGASVTSGVTLTKLVGVAVLAFATTRIFEVRPWRQGRGG
jgi:Niemann-Pick C1 protein